MATWAGAGRGAGVTGADVAAGLVVPPAVVAVTVNVCAVPLARPSMMTQSLGTFAVTVWPPDDVTV